MNSYTVPLNAEEKRHAQFQGDFKWFVYRLTKSYAESLQTMGVFKEKALTRMADATLLTELVHALLHGIATTRAKDLTKLYADHDTSFPESTTVKRHLTYALDEIIGLTDIHGTALMKPHEVYSLCLAIAHARFGLPALKSTYTFSSPTRRSQRMVENLSRLAAAVEDKENAPKKFATFISASESKTNTAEHRQTRFKWFCRAIEDAF
jgi:hypothetical protein